MVLSSEPELSIIEKLQEFSDENKIGVKYSQLIAYQDSIAKIINFSEKQDQIKASLRDFKNQLQINNIIQKKEDTLFGLVFI